MGYTPPGEIDIGNEAIFRSDSMGFTLTYIDGNNPANDTGKITKIEIYANVSMTGCKVAIFTQGASNVFSTRNYQTVDNGNGAGVVLAGSKQTFTVDLDVVVGDYIGIKFASGTISTDTITAIGIWYVNGDAVPCEDVTFTPFSDRTISLYGTGTSGSGELTIGEAFLTVDSWMARIGLLEAFTVADSLVKNVIKQLSEAFTVADSLVKNVIKQLSEAFSIADSKVTKIVKALGEAFSVVDSFAHTIILHFYEAISVKDSFTKYLLSLWHKVTKSVADWTKTDKEKDDWTKVNKEKEDFTKVTKETDDWTKVNKEKGDWNKKDKE